MCAINSFSKYACAVSVKYKEGIAITKSLWKVLSEAGRNPKTYGLVKAANFIKNLCYKLLSWPHRNNIEVGFTRTFKVTIKV